MKGLIILHWKDGSKRIYPIGTILHGIILNGVRPYKYSICVEDIQCENTEYLHSYLYHVTKVLEDI